MIRDVKFRKIEARLNDTLRDFVVEDSIHTENIRGQLFEELVKRCSSLDIVNKTINNSEFYIRYNFSRDFGQVKDFAKGSVNIHFKIRTSRTKNMRQISKTRKKYVSTRHTKPIQFSHFSIQSTVRSFDWSDEPDSLKIVTSGRALDSFEEIEGDTVGEVMAKLDSILPEKFRLKIVQPLAKTIQYSNMMGKTNKMKTIESILDGNLKKKVEKSRWSSVTFDDIEEFILENELLVVEP